LESDAAFAILEPYFEAAREVYMEYVNKRGLQVRGIKRVRLECRPDMHDTPRHFAGASEEGNLIAVAPQMVDLPEDTVAAILAHEFGHVVDFLNPGAFHCDVEERQLVFLPDEEEGERGDRVRLARLRQWRKRDEHAVELTADLIAEQAIGKRIGYSGPCLLQGFARGVPRPEHLR
jgi:hypothetical protein